MGKLAVIYWSSTGNTEAMANAIVKGAQGVGADVALFAVADISPEQAAGYDLLALGCPAMGAEVLEEGEFEPFFTQLEGKLAGKKTALFGSYGWGDGQWMRDWQERTAAAGAQLYRNEGLIINETPDADGISACESFGAGFAKA
ncbi:MAG: flavodoxin [Peptococcaceae bacterium]|jgi:flavodoxin short chain|nr:flavodoxin [Peptococcaceae bacterium]